jgi:hypothetical protein
MTEPNNELVPLILSAAIASAGPKGSNEGQWMGKVNQAIPGIAAMMNDRSRQWAIATEVLEAAVFVATYVSHEVEQSSTRCLVHIDIGKPTKNYPDGVEPIRTHRTDGAQGRHMKERLDQLEAGDEIVVWKALEANDDGTEKYRVLVHFTTRPKRTDRPAGPPASPVREQQAGPPPAAAPTSDGLTDAIDSERLNTWRAGAKSALTDEEYGRFLKVLASKGIDPAGCSEVEWDYECRPILRAIVSERTNQQGE